MDLLSPTELADMQATDESAMPDELRLQTATTATDGLGHTYDTGTYTTATTTKCRWRELVGRELEIARSLSADVTHNVWCPVSTPVTLNQRLQVFQSGISTAVLTARVRWIVTGSYPTSIRLLCEETTT